jgi:hypothetical protein
LLEFQVKNDNLSASTLEHNFDLIKLPGEQLFAFNEVVLGSSTIQSIRDEAAFLFTRLTRLRIQARHNKNALLIKKTIEIFQKIGQLEFIAIESETLFFLNLDVMDREILAQINSISLNMARIQHEFPTIKTENLKILENIFLCGADVDSEGRLVPGTTAWPALTELVLNYCEMTDINVQDFGDLFPRLENLRFISSYSSNKMLDILNGDSFLTMTNMRVLKLDRLTLQSFEIFNSGCLLHLDELDLSFASNHDSLTLTRIDTFPCLPQLTKLRLNVACVNWIHPNAFDHFTQLIRFQIYCQFLQTDTFETGVAARFMSFHVGCKVLKLTSEFISNAEELKMFCHSYKENTRLETVVALSGLRRLTTGQWANQDLPFFQMNNLEYLSLETMDLSIASCAHLKCLSKLKVLEVNYREKIFHDPSMYFFFATMVDI